MKKKTIEKTSLKVLYLEDSPPDVEIISKLLINAGYDISMDCTAKNNEFTSLLRSHAYDVILSDFKLPGFDAFSVLKLVLEICPEVPFICVSGSIGEETAIELIKQGAIDYVLKDRLVRLPLAIQRALKEVNEKKLLQFAEEALRESEENYRTFFKTSRDCVFITSVDGNWIDMNDAAIELFGYASREELIQVKISNLYVNADDRVKHISVIAERGYTKDYPVDLRKKDGSVIHTLITSSARRDADSHIIGFMGTIRDITKRKRAEEALQESEEKYRSIFENVQDVYYETLFDGTVLEVSPSIEFISKGQYHRADLIGKSMYEFYPDTKDRDTLIEAMQKTGSVIDFEVRLKNRDGSLIPCSISAKIKLDTQGRPEKIVGSMHDISKRKRADEVLRESEEKYRSFVDGANEAILVLQEGVVKFVNLRAVEVAGYSGTDIMGKHFREYIYPDDRQMVADNYVKRMKGEPVPSRYEFRMLSVDGRAKWVEMNTVQIDWNGKPASLIFLTDITDRKRAEEALQESELRFRSLYENATIGLYRTTPDGTILLANPALVKILGFPFFQKLAERNLEKDGFEPSYQRKEFLEKIERDGEVHGYESKWIRQDGTAIYVLESARAIRDSYGKTLYYDGTVENITERKQVEEALRQMQKLEGLGTLAGGIAHDFNNILGIILAYITIIKRFKDDTKKLDLAIETITKAVDRGKTLVQQILTFARKTETSFGAVNVNDVVMEIVFMIYEMFPKTVTCSQNFDKSIPYINADRSQLHQVLMNLCVNARDAMPKGGVLSINTHIVSVASLRNQHPDAAASGYVCIEVSDTGEGMSEEIQKRIFEPFFTTKEIGKGTGLGLAVVFGVVQTHKGFIDVKSELGKGTIFYLYLPVSQEAAPVSVKEKEETLDEIPGGSETLLVVEDEEILLTSLQMVLVDKGYNVLPAQDGFTALKIYQEKKNKISLVVTDLGLPNISGLEVCRKIKKINPNERIILATGFLDPEMKSEFLKVGIQHFLYKPYDLTKVLKVIREVLDKK